MSSAVAEMGDRLATIHIGEKVGGGYCATIREVEAGSPFNTMSSQYGELRPVND